MIEFLTTSLQRVYGLGGPIVLIMLAISILTLAVALYKVWQFSAAGVGRHKALARAVSAWDAGYPSRAEAELQTSTSYLAPVIRMGFEHSFDRNRLETEAETRFAKLEGGLRFLDTVAQLSPLLGLFGTVLGMISAFQALQEAGSQVDPSVLAGGIWVALLTTAVGLVIAMPTSLVLSWFESRLDRDRVLAGKAISTILSPGQTGEVEQTDSVETPILAPAHA
ncbi:MotA/TolQ/ExbB proton channel family protein [Tropicibacter sp. R15_0]|uniref:MotA/TolQ/ExbB proton channel family protein n=1 Tax=Tropicibacter sp. R15_0 TaxID=2821101 RepID=UPI001ADC6D1A|nr:MotA/TolQ/ExbB proton channel family protein [Tropicibacter sp. R15_0]MBO9467822.1 MotA/TolQ/ExbB proton channel family protein [Tropicibacter sp. R15_0]